MFGFNQIKFQLFRTLQRRENAWCLAVTVVLAQCRGTFHTTCGVNVSPTRTMNIVVFGFSLNILCGIFQCPKALIVLT